LDFDSCLVLRICGEDDFLDESDLFEDGEFESIPTIPDSLEGLNRSIFKFNDWGYINLLGPVAKVYHDATPDPIERAFINCFDSAKFPIRLAGNVLQGKSKESVQETGKLLVNSTIGIASFGNPSENIEGLDPPILGPTCQFTSILLRLRTQVRSLSSQSLKQTS
tara:strand:- start:5597 stop:6091 length:495 start_codon:yes stop_codon:yes gene_type:complete